MYDEVTRIETTLGRLAGSPFAAADTEILLVDDGSNDGTADVAAKTAADLGLGRARVLRLPENRGKGAAVRAGMLAATGRVRVFVDADLSVTLADIERCFAVLESGDADVAYGTRAHPASALERSQPVHRVASGRTFNLLLRGLGLTTDRDTQCGLKGFRAETIETVFGPLRTERFAFDVEALARATRAGFRVVTVPVTWSHVEASRVRAMRDGVDMAAAAVRIRRDLRREARSGSRTANDQNTDATTMAGEAFDAMARVERTHWWFRAKHDLVVELLKAGGIERGRVVDVGCGTGGHLERLRAAGHRVVGAELDPHALRFAANLDPRPPLVRSVAEALPFASASVDAVTALDVIEHLDDDVAAFRELRRVVRPGGLVIATVPAYRWAWSEHDVRLGHRRRYVRSDLRAAAADAGLTVVACSHFHSWLTPVAYAVRRTPAGRMMKGSAEEASFVSPTVNRLLCGVTRIERTGVRRGSVPFGLSVVLVGRNDQLVAPHEVVGATA